MKSEARTRQGRTADESRGIWRARLGWGMVALLFGGVACGEGDDGDPDGSGGASNPSGGGSGGTSPSGGALSGAGGSGATTGGVASGGGAVATGGMTSGGASSGGTSSGGRASGGASSDGGSGGQSSGGQGSGATGSGGESGEDDRCSAGVWDGSEPEVLSLSGNPFAHDPTMIVADGTYYRFWTGDYIPSATSNDLRSWQNAGSVYDGSYPSWSSQWLMGVAGQTFNFPWAPDVSYFHGRYHLYSSFSAKFGDNISCITHLSTTDLASGDWTDHGPVICTEGNENYNAIDADVELDEDGNAWLAFGSFWDGIFAFPLTAEGDRADGELTRLAWASQIEAPVLLRRCGYYYLFVTWGLCCPGEGRSVNDLSYRVAVGRAENILGPYVDKTGKPLLEGGGTLLVEGDKVQWAAAGHSDVLVDGDQIYHLYHAYRQSNGGAVLRIVELPFDDEGWPVAGGP